MLSEMTSSGHVRKHRYTTVYCNIKSYLFSAFRGWCTSWYIVWICIQALSAPFEASLVESSLGQCAVRKPETLNIDVTLSEFCEFRWCLVALLPWDKSSHICLSLIQAKQEWQRPEEGNIIKFVDGSLDLWCFDVLQDSDLDTVQGALRSRIQAKVTESMKLQAPKSQPVRVGTGQQRQKLYSKHLTS